MTDEFAPKEAMQIFHFYFPLLAVLSLPLLVDLTQQNDGSYYTPCELILE